MSDSKPAAYCVPRYLHPVLAFGCSLSYRTFRPASLAPPPPSNKKVADAQVDSFDSLHLCRNTPPNCNTKSGS